MHLRPPSLPLTTSPLPLTIMRTALHALGFWLLLCAFGLLWALCGALEFIFRPRWPRRR